MKSINWTVKLKNNENVLGVILWGLGVAIVSIVFIWFLHNYLGGLAVLALGFLYLRFYHLSPIEKKVILNNHGIIFGNDQYLFSDILTFAILKVRRKEMISFLTTSRTGSELIIELPDTLIKEKIKHFLSRELPRQKRVNVFNAFHVDTYLGI